jgi:large subunit ribosomal protein L31
MKPKIHPQYNEIVVRCACGAEFKTRSTKKELRLDICSECHPFYTGKQKLLDTAGRVERFKKRVEKTAAKAEAAEVAKATKAAAEVKAETPAEEKPKAKAKAKPKAKAKKAEAAAEPAAAPAEPTEN